MIYGVGQLETGIAVDYGQLVIDDEFVGMVKYVLRGIPVNDETLAVDVIREIGPHGHFLAHDHTFEHMKTDQTHPNLIDRHIRQDWESAGRKSLYDKAWEKVGHILKTHQPEPLPSNVVSDIRAIVEGAEEELGVSKK